MKKIGFKRIIMATGALLAVGTLCAHGGTALWPSESGVPQGRGEDVRAPLRAEGCAG